MSYPNWHQFTVEEPCPLCHKPSPCKRSGPVVMCLRVSEGAFKTSKGWHFHRIDDSSADHSEGSRQANHKAGDSGSKKTFATLDEAIAVIGNSVGGQLVGRWAYHRADGTEALWVLRFDLPGGEKSYRPMHPYKGRVRIGDPSGQLPLYRLLDLANDSGPVYVVEGEKAADAARNIGLLATTSAHGAGSAEKSDWSPLAGRDVIILPDQDEAGRKYAQLVGKHLLGLDPPARVRSVELPGLNEGEDIVEFIKARDSVQSQSIRREVEALVQTSPVMDSQEIIGGPVLTCFADVESRPVTWLWKDRIALGRIVLLSGLPGEGKTFLLTDISARVTTGSPWPDGGGNAPEGEVILISVEDDPGDTLRPRLEAHYADLRRVHLLSAVRHIDEDGKMTERMFSLQDIVALELALRRRPECRLVVVDPIGSFLGGRTDAHRDNEVRSILAPLAQLAVKYNVAVVVIAHRRKSASSIADDLVLGSRAFTGLARAVWHLIRDPKDKRRRLLLPGKNNLAAEGDGLAFAIEGEPARLYWERDPVRMTADEAIAAEAKERGAKPGPTADARIAAEEWLKEVLKNGPVPSGDPRNPEPGTIRFMAKEAGVSWSTVRRAAEALGVRAEKSRLSDKWQWRLPTEPDEPGEVDNPSNMGNPTQSTTGQRVKTSDAQVAQAVHVGPVDEEWVDAAGPDRERGEV